MKFLCDLFLLFLSIRSMVLLGGISHWIAFAVAAGWVLILWRDIRSLDSER
jgi:hypothetical protein